MKENTLIDVLACMLAGIKKKTHAATPGVEVKAFVKTLADRLAEVKWKSYIIFLCLQSTTREGHFRFQGTGMICGS